MVIICEKEHTNSEYNEHFDRFKFPLSDFQKHAIQGIVDGNHVLITAHTGSGKTLPAEFSINYFVEKGKKVIYTSPIKALSNQKFYEFTKDFPHISFGILTGDIKFNPEADVLIMTTEILQNTLYQRERNEKENNDLGLHFNMDLENELACVIFDEIHYINDMDRGKVWEESILMLPKHVQMLMLSATIDKPEIFAQWCEDRFPDCDKKVILAPTYHRVVPLTHYIYTTTNKGIYKHEKDKTIQNEIKNYVNKLHVIRDEKGKFIEQTYLNTKKKIELFTRHQMFMAPSMVLNNLIRHLYMNDMLPALCFVFSRKNVEKYAQQITVNLFDEGSNQPSIIKKECMNILRKLPNFEEYTQLPEFEFIIRLLEKGVAIHHSGIMPIFREMIELLFSKGYIKVLFATETFAVGINMPTKTVIFSALSKFDGTGVRELHSHEYTQMAGRAGRRGLDKVGHVIHAVNMFSNHYPNINTYRNVLSGKPQSLVSKFKIDYNLIMSLISMEDFDFEAFVSKSMVQHELDKEKNTYERNINELQDKASNEPNYNTDKYDLMIYYDYISQTDNVSQKQRKKLNVLKTNMEKHNKNIKNDLKKLIEFDNIKGELVKNENGLSNVNNYLKHNVDKMMTILNEFGFVEHDVSGNIILSLKGRVASQIHEVHCLLFADMFMDDVYNNLSPIELVGLFSCFTNIRVQDEIKDHKPKVTNPLLHASILKIPFYLKLYEDREAKDMIDCGTREDPIHYDIINDVMQWCEAEDEISCKLIIQNLSQQKGVFVGEFVKAILKINNIVAEMQTMCEYIGNIALMEKVSKIPALTLKFVATNQSLYI